MSESQTPKISLWQTIKGDFAKQTGWKLLAVVGLLAWMAFQWGWGNDILLPSIAAWAFNSFDDGSTWSSGLLATSAATAAGGLFWAATQALDGIVVLTGLRLVPGITQRISDFLQRKGWVKPFAELSRGTRFLIAYASGASVLCLVDVFATGQPGLRSRWKMLAESVALSAGGVAIIVAVVAGLGAMGKRVPATADATDTMLRYAQNPLTWLAIYATAVAAGTLFSRLRGLQE